jgi:ATP-dependent RNA helicase DeaD
MNENITFAELGLSPLVLEAVQKIGYETPSPIQAEAIPVLLEGKNLLGTAQTGTGKTAAFTLPLLSRLDFNGKNPQLLVLTPTRELAIQVSEAVQKYASSMRDLHVLPVYGGQDIGVQFRALRRTVHVIVATPGRLIDHLERKSIDLSNIQAVVLDEADEMLNMGFQEAVESILSAVPETAQRALFSATMPPSVQHLVSTYLGDYETIRIQGKTTTVESVQQRFLAVRAEHKLEAITRVLEGEDFDGMIIFVRTKQATAELSERLEARGFSAAPLSGDLAQALRERTVNRLKEGKIDILVATDVAARGLDVDRITHVLNYDIPYDTESYVHRIGRTGRAGRTGQAILFVTPRERGMLKTIERATRQPIAQMSLPTGQQISDKRITAFRQKIQETIESQELEEFRDLLTLMSVEESLDMADVAAALAFLTQQEQPLFPKMAPIDSGSDRFGNDRFGNDRGDRGNRREREPREPRAPRQDGWAPGSADNGPRPERALRPERGPSEGFDAAEEGMQRYYIGLGRMHDIQPKDIVGAIANEADISSQYIGKIKLFDHFSFVELPEGMPSEVMQTLQAMRIRSQPARFRLMTDEPPPEREGGFGRKPFGGDRGGFGDRAPREGSFGGDRGPRKPFGDRGGFGGERPARDSSFHERGGDKPFHKTRRFGRN